MKPLRHLPSGCSPSQIDLIAASSSHIAYCTSKSTYLYNLETYEFSQMVTVHEKPITCVTFDPSTPTSFMTSGLDSRLIHWKTGSKQPWLDGNIAHSVSTISTPDIPTFMDWCPADSNIIAVLQRNGKVVLAQLDSSVSITSNETNTTGAVVSTPSRPRRNSKDRVNVNAHTPNQQQPPTPQWGITLAQWPDLYFFDQPDNEVVTCFRWSAHSSSPDLPLLLALGTTTGDVRIWSKTTNQSITISPPAALQGEAVRELRWHPTDPTLLLCLYGKSQLVLFHTTTASTHTVFRPQSHYINAVVFGEYGNTLLTVSEGCSEVTEWSLSQDIPTGSFPLSFMKRDVSIGNILTVQSQQRTLLLSVLSDGGIHSSILASQHHIATINTSHAGAVFDVKQCPHDPRYLLTGGWDGSVRVWRTDTLTYSALLHYNANYASQHTTVNASAVDVNGVKSSMDSSTPLLVLRGNSYTLYEPSSGASTHTLPAHSAHSVGLGSTLSAPIASAAPVVPTRLGFRTGTSGPNAALVGNTASTASFATVSSVEATLKGHNPNVLADTLKAGSSSTVIPTMTTTTSGSPTALTNGLSAVYSVAWHPTLPQVAAATSTGDVVVWSVADTDVNDHSVAKHVAPSVVAVIPLHSKPVIKVAWCPHDDTVLASSCGDQYATLFRTDGLVLNRLTHPMEVYGVEFNPLVAGLVATACVDGIVRLWDVSSLLNNNTTVPHTSQAIQPLMELRGHKARVFSLSWSPLVKGLLASASDDNTVRVWDVARGVCVAVLSGHTDKVRAICWNHELPHLLVSGAWDGNVRLWDIRESKCLGVYSHHEQDIYAITTHPHTPTVYYSASRDGSVREWSLGKGLLVELYSQAVMQGKIDVSFIGDVNDILTATLPSNTNNHSSSTATMCGEVSRNMVFGENKTSSGVSAVQDVATVRDLHNFFGFNKGSATMNGSVDELFTLCQKILDSEDPEHGKNGPLNNKTTHLNDLRGAMWRKARGIVDPIVSSYSTVSAPAVDDTPAPASPVAPLSSKSKGKSAPPPVVAAPVVYVSHYSLPSVVSEPSQRAQLAEAAALFLQLGNLYEYCQVQLQLGHWERALALAPCVNTAYWRLVLQGYAQYLGSTNKPDSLPFVMATGDVDQYRTILNRTLLTPVVSHDVDTGAVVGFTNARGQLDKGDCVYGQDRVALAVAESTQSLPPSIVDHSTIANDNQELQEWLAFEKERETSDLQEKDLIAIEVTPALKTLTQQRAMSLLHNGNAIGAACEYLKVSDIDNCIRTLIQGDEVLLAVSLCQLLMPENMDYVWRIACSRFELLGLWDEALACLQQLQPTSQSMQVHPDIYLLCARFNGTTARRIDFYAKAGLESPQHYATLGVNALGELRETVTAVPHKATTSATASKGRSRPVAAEGNSGEAWQKKAECVTNLVIGCNYKDSVDVAIQWLFELLSRPSWTSAEFDMMLKPLASVQLNMLSPVQKQLVLAYVSYGSALRSLVCGYTSISPFLFASVTQSMTAVLAQQTQNNRISNMINNTTTSPPANATANKDQIRHLTEFPIPASTRSLQLAAGLQYVDPVTAFVMANDVVNDASLASSSKIKTAAIALKKTLETHPLVFSLITSHTVPNPEEEKKSSRTASATASTATVPSATNVIPTLASQCVFSEGSYVVSAETGAMTITHDEQQVLQFVPKTCNLAGPRRAISVTSTCSGIVAQHSPVSAGSLFGQTVSSSVIAGANTTPTSTSSTPGAVLISRDNVGELTCMSFGSVPSAVSTLSQSRQFSPTIDVAMSRPSSSTTSMSSADAKQSMAVKHSHIGGRSDVAGVVRSFMTGKPISGEPVLLEDGTNAISRAEALMLMQLMPFSPLLTGNRLKID